MGQAGSTIAALDNPSGLVEFVDPEAGRFAFRFYRLEMLSMAK